MEPALRDGDWLVVRTARRLPRLGELVVVRDPESAGRLLVKRVGEVEAGGFRVASDAAEHAAHLAERGLVGLDALVGRPVFRYAPLGRIGRVR